jgi:hypothetical protein
VVFAEQAPPSASGVGYSKIRDVIDVEIVPPLLINMVQLAYIFSRALPCMPFGLFPCLIVGKFGDLPHD